MAGMRQYRLYQLTPREQEVASLRAAGKTYSQIADILMIGVETVKSHCKHIRQKVWRKETDDGDPSPLRSGAR